MPERLGHDNPGGRSMAVFSRTGRGAQRGLPIAVAALALDGVQFVVSIAPGQVVFGQRLLGGRLRQEAVRALHLRSRARRRVLGLRAEGRGAGGRR